MINAFGYLLIFVAGLVVGSFLSALTYRLPLGIQISKGRSFCDKCGQKINWYDNIPIFSYFFLDGKCRYCKKVISLRYPLIEFGTLVTFLSVTHFFNYCSRGGSGAICEWKGILGFWAVPFLLFVSAGIIAVFITDYENQIILDSIILPLFALSLLLLIFFNPDYTFHNILSAFAGSLFLLILNLITKGKGMGLGDVKLALLGGIILGWPSTSSWLLSSFIIGAFVGLFLVLIKKARFGKNIAFGPFLVISFFLALFWGTKIFESFIH
jgi:leader peptidase (prepilin peptidase)/N-methyltransferase